MNNSDELTLRALHKLSVQRRIVGALLQGNSALIDEANVALIVNVEPDGQYERMLILRSKSNDVYVEGWPLHTRYWKTI